MTTPTFANIFQLFYTLYRGEATVPGTSDDEWAVALRLANEAIARWATYDNVFWNELFTTAQTTSTGGVVIATSGTSSYAAPTAMKQPGGYVRLINGTTTSRRYPIIQPYEAQFRNDAASYVYFTGNPATGFTLHFNTAPDASVNGHLIDYVYYKKPTELVDGTSTTECPDVEFIVNRMLANRFRISRNPYYKGALQESEDRLSVMKMTNDSGNWANPWSLPDRSATIFGV